MAGTEFLESLQIRHYIDTPHTSIVADFNEITVGVLEYYLNPNGVIEIEDLLVPDKRFRRRGIASLLLKELVSITGHDVPFSGVVTNKPTRNALKKLDIINQAKELGEFRSTDPELLAKLPLVTVLRSGNLIVEELIVKNIPFRTNRPLGRKVISVEILGKTGLA